MMLPRVPTVKMSSAAGSWVLAFFWAQSRSSLFWRIASSMAAIDFSRPTKSGTTMWGKTMMSRSGSNGRIRVFLPSGFRPCSSPRNENMGAPLDCAIAGYNKPGAGKPIFGGWNDPPPQAGGRGGVAVSGDSSAGTGPELLGGLRLFLVQHEGILFLENRLLVEDHLAGVLARGDLIH